MVDLTVQNKAFQSSHDKLMQHAVAIFDDNQRQIEATQKQMDNLMKQHTQLQESLPILADRAEKYMGIIKKIQGEDTNEEESDKDM